VEDSFVCFVLGQLRGVKRLGCRAMFGAHGLFRGPRLFGIVSGGRVYFRTGEATAGAYALRGMEPFRADAPGPLRNYLRVPPEVLEDPERLRAWANEAAEVGAADGARVAGPW
jgi:DNA transformation protein